MGGMLDRPGRIGGALLDLPRGHFQVILADPPFSFATWSVRGQKKSPQQHYSYLGVDEIAALPVEQLAALDAALFLWVPYPAIFMARDIIKAWGFRYSGLAWVWIKFNPATGKYAFGTGYGTRKNCEQCLLARRGSPNLKRRSVRDLILAPRREHSRKPDEQYANIEAMYDGPYLELFARQARTGWTSWGDEVGMFHIDENGAV